MAKVKALVSLTNPGSTDPRKGLVAHIVEEWKKKYGIKGVSDQHGNEDGWFDTISGWWNLRQLWFEFECEVNTEWDSVRPLFLDEMDWEEFYHELQEGRILMMVHYINEKDGEKKYTPHH